MWHCLRQACLSKEDGVWFLEVPARLGAFSWLVFVRVPEMIPWMFGCGNGGTVDTSRCSVVSECMWMLFFSLTSRCDWCQKRHILERSAWCVKLPSTTRRNGSRFPSSAQGPSYPRDLVIKLVHTWHIVEENSPPSIRRFRRWSRFGSAQWQKMDGFWPWSLELLLLLRF